MKIRQCRGYEIDRILEMLRKEEIYHSKELYLLVLSSYPDLCLVAEDDGKICGFGMACLISERVGRILVLYVAPRYRRRGIGKALLKEMLRRLSCHYHVKEVVLEVRKSNVAAINLYKSFGFFPTAVLPSYYGDEDGILMKKEIIPRLFSSLQMLRKGGRSLWWALPPYK